MEYLLCLGHNATCWKLRVIKTESVISTRRSQEDKGEAAVIGWQCRWAVGSVEYWWESKAGSPQCIYPQLNGIHDSHAQNNRLHPSLWWKGIEVRVLVEGKYRAMFGRHESASCWQATSEAQFRSHQVCNSIQRWQAFFPSWNPLSLGSVT